MTLNASEAASIWGAIIEGIFYGIHMVLFILYLVLRRRNSRGFDGPLARAQILLFGLCTIAMCFDFTIVYFLTAPGTGSIIVKLANLNAANAGSVVAFTIIDYLAQMMLLYRCWIIWGRRWVVVAVPGLLALVSLGGGVASFIFGSMLLPSTNLKTNSHLLRITGILAYSTSLIVNALTTSLIVTKILLTSREVHPSSGSSSRPLRTIVAMLIESGLLMLIFQLIFVILFSAQAIGFDTISGATTQIYGITPTLLNIRVVMGSVRDKTTEKTHSLRFAHSGGATTQGTGAHMSVTGAQFQDIDTEADDGCENEKTADNTV